MRFDEQKIFATIKEDLNDKCIADVPVVMQTNCGRINK